jgi:hypothetical protein
MFSFSASVSCHAELRISFLAPDTAMIKAVGIALRETIERLAVIGDMKR